MIYLKITIAFICLALIPTIIKQIKLSNKNYLINRRTELERKYFQEHLNWLNSTSGKTAIKHRQNMSQIEELYRQTQNTITTKYKHP